MKLVTQDGRTLKVLKRDRAEFHAVNYIGRVNTAYVDVRLCPRTKGRRDTICIKLGEYADIEIAESEVLRIETALSSAAKEFVMSGNTGIAPNDDLQEALKAAKAILLPACKLGYYLEVGMINGKSNDSRGFNPDERGSYATALIELRNRHKQDKVVNIKKGVRRYEGLPKLRQAVSVIGRAI